MTPATAAIETPFAARMRRQAITTIPAPVDITPARPLWSHALSTTPADVLERAARRLAWALFSGLALIAVAIAVGLLWPR